MKDTFQLLNYVAVLLIAITSCHKAQENTNGYVAPPPLTVIDTLRGKEFIFSDLTWDYWLDSFGEVYIDIENRALFRNDRLVEVSVKSVTDSTWVAAHRYNLDLYFGYYVGYLFSIERGHLYVLPFPYIYRISGNTQLAGSKASLKVKFL